MKVYDKQILELEETLANDIKILLESIENEWIKYDKNEHEYCTFCHTNQHYYTQEKHDSNCPVILSRKYWRKNL